MPSRFLRSIIVLVLMGIGFGKVALAQATPQQTPNSPPCVGMEQKEVKSFRGGDHKPIRISLCDGSNYVGNITEMKADNFTLKTTRNQFVQITYANVTEIKFLPKPPGQSPGETAALVGMTVLLAPLLIFLGLITGWDGC
jgi:hypothetical protein